MAQKVWQLIPLTEPENPCRLESFPVVIGRSDECGIPITDETVSPCHARLTERGHKLQVEDLDSAHGTLVNDQPIHRAMIRRDPKGRTRLQVGHTVFRVFYGEVGTAAATLQGELIPDASEEWFYSHEMNEFGPMGAPELSAAAGRGDVGLTDEVWRTGDTQRQHLFELRSHFPEIDKALTMASAPPVSSPPAGQPPAGPLAVKKRIREKMICPFCWSRFDLEDLLSIAAHPDLAGDPILGEEEPQRFVPMHFVPDGRVVDSKGMMCRESACPNCHMRLP
ncbi:MAG: FHA domain-containing protein, partial [Lentisphaerota bacterium]